LEDVASVLITAPVARIQAHFLAEASIHHIPVVICENFRPTGIFIPVGRSTDTLLTRAQIRLTKRTKENLWLKTIDAKCDNQYYLATDLAPQHPQLKQIDILCSQKTITMEGACAHLYWQIYSEVLRIDAFCRDPKESSGVNSLLNYAYAMLLTLTLQRLLCVGLDPMYGIGHVIHERATPLAYDVMEPFRPLVDYWVFQWIKEQRHKSLALDVCRDYKIYLRMCFEGTHFGLPPLNNLIQGSVNGLRNAVLNLDVRSYQPWLWRITKWDGFLSALTFQ
jgi:CRISPR-associated protein Cas1